MERRIASKKLITKPELLEIEQSGAPEAIAAHHLDVAPSFDTRPIPIPRASSLYSACMRYHVIGYRCKLPQNQRVGVAMRVIFSLGSAIHTWLQNTPDVLGINRVGWWQCQACNHETWSDEGWQLDQCPKCGAYSAAMIYKEHEMLTSAPYQSSGHPDMFIRINGKVRVLEAKTIAGDAFEKLCMPLIEHQWQIQHYMWGCSQDKTIPVEIDPEVGYVLYISKVPSWKKVPFKMFVETKNLGIQRQIKAKLKVFSQGMKSIDYSPVHKDCIEHDFEGQMGKWCAMRRPCKEFYEAGL